MTSEELKQSLDAAVNPQAKLMLIAMAVVERLDQIDAKLGQLLQADVPTRTVAVSESNTSSSGTLFAADAEHSTATNRQRRGGRK